MTSFVAASSSTNIHRLHTTQGQRQRLVAHEAMKWCSQWYNVEGRWIDAAEPPDTRKTLWLCFGLLAGNRASINLANKILARLEFQHHHPTRTQQEQQASFDIFISNHAIQFLTRHGKKLTPEVYRKIEEWGRRALGDYPGNRQADYQFHGANDNMPAKATLGLILGGQLFGDDTAIQHGLWNLRQLRSLLTRRGLISEYTSPTYLPLTLVNLTEVAHYAHQPEARQLSVLCLQRIWADFLGHFHPPTGMLAGPYSRAYQLDDAGHLSNAACALWLALGERVILNPIDELNREPMRVVHHHSNRYTQLGQLCWISSCTLTPPRYLLNWLKRRSYPFQLLANAERGEFNSSFAGEINTTCHAEADFALGTAEGESWTQLQADPFFINYRRSANTRQIEDIRTLYTRYLINDQSPGDLEKDHLLRGNGIVHTVHSGRTALVTVRPALSLAGQEVRRLKFSMILPEHFGQHESLMIRGHHCFLKDGPFYLALRLLTPTAWSEHNLIRLEPVSNYQVLSIYNYEGPCRSFTEKELGRTLNGFIATVGLRSEEPFEAFISRIEKAELLDYFSFGTRTTQYRLEQLTLALSYAVHSDRVRYRTINSQPVPEPLWQADGLPSQKLPFLKSKRIPKGLTPTIPHRHLNVVWTDQPWIIASNPGVVDQSHPATSA